jgi:hypothetical protein
MRTAQQLTMLAEDYEALASTASNLLAKAQWSVMAQEYRKRALELEGNEASRAATTRETRAA